MRAEGTPLKNDTTLESLALPDTGVLYFKDLGMHVCLISIMPLIISDSFALGPQIKRTTVR